MNRPLAKVVIPAKAGIQRFANRSKRLDSRFRGNDILALQQNLWVCLWGNGEAPYLKVIKKKAPQAMNVLDRFHIIKHIQ